MGWGLEPENDGIADIQVADRAAGSLDLPRFRHDVADRVNEATDARGDWDCGRCAGTHRTNLTAPTIARVNRFDPCKNDPERLSFSRKFYAYYPSY
jgi:hypothetical protein